MAWPVGPLLEPGAAAVIGEPDDPQIAVLLDRRISIVDLDPDHRRRVVDRNDVGGHREDLVRGLAFLLPHPLDRVQAGNWLFVGGLRVDGVAGEQRRHAVGARRPPRSLVSRQPLAHRFTVNHLPHDARAAAPANRWGPGGGIMYASGTT